MTVEYVLLIVCVFMISMKFFASAPSKAFRESGPRMAARVEQQLSTGGEFKTHQGAALPWEADQ